MFGSNILEVGLGLVFVFLLLSLISSAANELIEAFARQRAAFLEKGIKELVGNLDLQASKDFVKNLYNHGLINALYPGSYEDGKKDLPSYIPARNFAMALLDLAKTEQLPPNIQKSLDAFEKVAQGKAEVMRSEVENWYNSSMDRVSGWYKRRSQFIVLTLGVLVTILANADCIQIAQRLSTDTNLRQAVATQAQKQAGAPSTIPTDVNANLEQLKNNLASLDGVGLPLGWTPAPKSMGDVGRAIVAHWVGWLITALAVSLGAPFWFDVLNKFIVVRSTVKPAEKSGPEASKDATPTQQKPLVLTVQAAPPAANQDGGDNLGGDQDNDGGFPAPPASDNGAVVAGGQAG